MGRRAARSLPRPANLHLLGLLSAALAAQRGAAHRPLTREPQARASSSRRGGGYLGPRGSARERSRTRVDDARADLTALELTVDAQALGRAHLRSDDHVLRPDQVPG